MTLVSLCAMAVTGTLGSMEKAEFQEVSKQVRPHCEFQNRSVNIALLHHEFEMRFSAITHQLLLP